MKKLPIGIQTFSSLIQDDFVYIDKTATIFELVRKKSAYFLSRPRRFGKSLLISTMQAIFEGKRELFKGFAIDKLDYDWKVRPVIRISFSSVPHKTPDKLEASLRITLRSLYVDYNLVPDENCDSSFLLINLVKKLCTLYGPVVILIDEYDKPVIDAINDPEVAEAMRTALREFYQVFKDLDEYLYFLFITGVSKFTQTSIFSGLNNLHDLSLHPRYATLCGYTKDEVEKNFVEHIQEWAKKSKKTVEEIIELLEKWYNGYSFEWGCEKIFNPFSVLSALESNVLRNYWVMTGMPNFLATMFKWQNPLPQLDHALRIDADHLVITRLDELSLVPVLVQTGYLTIVGQDQDGYLLDFPNYEVSKSYTLWSLAGSFNKEATSIQSLGVVLRKALKESAIDEFFKQMIPLFASIPHDIQVVEREKYYQSMIYLLCLLVGIDMGIELSTNVGTIDAVIKTDDCIFIFEFKLRGTAQEALDQIKSKKYFERFLNDGKKIILIGAQFSIEQRNIVAWLVENL